MTDARFEDGGDRAIRLTAMDLGDLEVMSALTQDGLGKIARCQWMPRRRRFSMLLYRFRWEDVERARRERRDYERVAAALVVDDVMKVRSTGIDHRDKEAVFALLQIKFEPEEDGAGRLRLMCAEDVTFEFEVECLNVSLKDLTRPWAAGGEPQHFS